MSYNPSGLSVSFLSKLFYNSVVCREMIVIHINRSYPLKHKCLLTSGDAIGSPSPLEEDSLASIHKIISAFLDAFISVCPLTLPLNCLFYLFSH